MEQSLSDIQAEMIEFFQSDRFACSPFKALLHGSTDPSSHVSILPEEPYSRAQCFRKHLRNLLNRKKPAHVFVQPQQVTQEEKCRKIAEELNIEAALELCSHYGYDDDSHANRMMFREWIRSLMEVNGEYDVVKEVSTPLRQLPEFFATYMTPRLPESDTRYAPYPLIAVVSTVAVGKVREEVRKSIIESAIDRNSTRGFNGSYYSEQGLRSKESL